MYKFIKNINDSFEINCVPHTQKMCVLIFNIFF
jgi:hypothetical protein